MSEIVYSVVIPVYNSNESVVELCGRLVRVFEDVVKESFEIILVDDGSPNPDTWGTLEGIHEKDRRVKIIQLMKNFGQQSAIMCGLNYSCGDFVISMDDDLQNPPEEIPKLIDAMGCPPHYDAVFAIPQHRKHATYRNIGSFMINKILGVAIKKPKHITLSSFRIITKELKNAMLIHTCHIVTTGALISQTTRNIANIEVQHDIRRYGKSNYSISRLVAFAFANIFNFSDFPLKALSIVGFLTSILSIIYAFVMVLRKLSGLPIQAGFSTIVVLISFYSGLILCSFGVIGQYIIRIMRGVTGVSQFVVRKKRG